MVRFCDLPSEVVDKIMLLVPADSLVECKSVNKFWYSFISTFINDPKFVAKHLLITKNQPSISLICCEDPSPPDYRLVKYPLLTINDDDADDDGKKEHFRTVTANLSHLSIPLLEINHVPLFGTMHHCDGLLLLDNYDLEAMVLCNPTLKEFMVLPKPKNVKEDYFPNIGFEHDSRNNKYKCVAIWLDEDECDVEVYTVGSDSWREIKMSQDIKDYIAFTQLCNGLCFGGVCYWCVREVKIVSILSFDMSSEEFRIIDLPDFEPLFAIEDWFDSYDLHLSVWYNSIVLSLVPLVMDTPSLDESIFFVFNLYEFESGDYAWTKYEQIGPLGKYFDNLITFWKIDEILMQVFEDDRRIKRLASCNFSTRKLRNVVVDSDRNICSDWVCLYEKSLVSIRRR